MTTKKALKREITIYQKIEFEQNKRLDEIYFLMSVQEEIFVELRDTINFYSSELPATIENQAFFKSLADQYSKIRENKKELFYVISGEENENY